MTDRIEVQRTIAAPAADIFAVLTDPQGHVAIDATGMLQDAEGERVRAAGDSFVVHMDREALNDFPMGKYDVTVSIRDFEQDALISWTILGRIPADRPRVRLSTRTGRRRHGGDVVLRLVGHRPALARRGHFPESAMRATLGILDRTVKRGYPRASTVS